MIPRLACLLLLAWLAALSGAAAQNLPHITQQPTNLTVTPGSTVTFSVVATGDEPLSYQWYFDLFTPVPNGTSATLVLTNVQPTNAGTYQVVITNIHGVVNSVEALLSVKHPPAVLNQPVSLVVTQGHDATFQVELSGDGPWRCQWYFNATNAVAGATNFSLILPDAKSTQAGTYALHATNDVGFVVSAAASLEVRIPPIIITSPGPLTVVAGTPTTFTVTATGDEPMQYQWFFNGTTAVPNATAATLQIPSPTLADAGSYSVSISNPVGTITSTAAILTVHTVPQISQQPSSLAVTQGHSASFTVTASGFPTPVYQWYFNGTNPIAGATSPTFTLPSAQFFNAGAYSVTASNAAGQTTSSPAQLAVRVPPAILQQPVSRIIAPGSTAIFSVLALGDAPLRYQWFLNATNPVTNGTNATLQIVNVQAALAGPYSVRVSNEVGAITSQSATLTIKQPPVIQQQPVSLVVTAGTPATFSVVAGGDGPIGYRWVFNQTNVVATTPSYTIPNAQLAHIGIYSVLVTNDAGSVLSALVSLNVRTTPIIAQQPANTAVAPGANATFSVVASGAQPLRYQWYLNGTTPLAGATNATLLVTNAAPGPDTTYSVVVANDIGTVTSSSALLRVRETISITQQPASLTVTQGHTATFATALSGDGPFTYQWYFNGTTALANERNSTLVLSNVLPAHAGNYSVRITNLVSAAASTEATLTVRLLPTIVQQPASQFRAPGSEAAFSVVATGETPFTYQWLFNSTPLFGETNQTLVRTNLQSPDAGGYRVEVRNGVGVATSAIAQLTVQLPPTIVTAPTSVISTQGGTASFSVVAGGDGPFRYQWFFNGTTPLSSATNAMLQLPIVQPQHAGVYSVQVSNAVGSVTSDAATLTVNLWPVLTQSPVSVVATQAQSLSLTVTATSETPLIYRWRRNGVDVPDSNVAALTWTNLQPTNAGSYDVIVANEFGSATSTVATVTVFGLDFGDAPEPNYPTYLANNGARHVIIPGVYLGVMVDPEPDGQPTFTATADDLGVGTNEIENGIRFVSPLRAGQPATIEVLASIAGQLNAWIDLDRVNGWAQAGEQVLTNQALVAGTNLVALRIPANVQSGPTFARFRFSTAGNLPAIGFAPDGEVEDYALTILPAADLTVAQTVATATVTAGNNATFTLNVTNRGPSAATGVTLFEQLSSRSTFISATPSQGACGHTNGVVTCNIGNLASGARATVAVVARISAGTNGQQAIVSAAEFDSDTNNNRAAVSTVGILNLPAGSNTDPIILPVDDPGPGDLYPSQITISGATSSVFKVTVTVRDINHSFPDDIDILLVGPRGQKVMLMSDVGIDNALTDVTVTFDDDAAQGLPDSDPQIVTGTYRPTNFGSTSDEFEAPAPPAPYVTNLATFRGSNPNGTWSLFVRDDQPLNANPQGGDPGFVGLGWTLTITTGDPMADLFLTQSSQPNPVIVGNSLTCTINVTNRGPAISSAIVNDPLPPGVNFVSATSTRGSCTANAGLVSCDLGSLASGAGARIVLVLAPTLGGSITNTVTVTGNQLDLSPADNSASVVTTVLPVADLQLGATAPSAALLGQPVTQALSVTNLGPNVATTVVLTNALASGANFVSAIASQGSCAHQNGVVTCQLGDLPPSSVATLQIVATTGALGLNSNVTSVGAAPLDFTPANNLATTLTAVSPAADIAMTAVTPSGRILAGRDFVTTITVSNRGPSTADVQLVDPLPSLVTFASAETTRGACSVVASTVRCDLNGLASGQSAIVVVTARTSIGGTFTNLISAIGSVGDPVPGNNSATNIVMVVPATDLVLSVADRPDPLWLGENLTYTLAITNQGPYPASTVLLTNLLPPGVTHLSTTWSQGACARIGDEVSCNFGALATGAAASVTIAVRPTSPGLLSSLAQLTSDLPDSNPANNAFVATTRVVTSSGSFASGAVTVPRVGPANPYPSTLFVSGLTASVFQVRVVLTNLSHSYADDLDLLLVGPDGRAALLLSDVGGESDLQNITLTLDDQAPSALPDLGILGAGLYRPANYELTPDTFPAPAPAPPYGSALSTFVGMDPNGPWSLYLVDDADKDAGTLEGWRLIFSTLDPIADLQLTQDLSANPAAVSSNLVFSYTITNRGPANATNARFTNALPAQLQGVGFSTSQGACNLVGGTLVCALGTIPASNHATVSVSGSALATGANPNVVTVTSDLLDLQPTNNAITTVVVFENPPIITLQPVSQIVTNGSGAVFSGAAIGNPPLFYQWQRNGVNVTGATNAALVFESVTSFNAGTYRLRVSNRVGVATSDGATLTVVGPPTISDVPDQMIAEDTATGLIPFTVIDFESPPETIQVFGDSSDHTVVPPGAIVFAGTGSERTVRVTPLPDRTGTITIFVIARDPDDRFSTNLFLLTITDLNDLPSMSDIPDQIAAEDVPLPVPFTVTDIETAPESLLYTLTSSNPALVSSTNVLFSGTGTNRIATITPALNQHGTAHLTLSITDGSGAVASDSFELTVVPVNDPPTVAALEDITINEDSGLHTVNLTGITSGAPDEIQNLIVTAHSSQASIIPNPAVSYASPATTGSITFAPLPNASGSVVLTVTVTDGHPTNAVFNRSFTVYVLPANDPPTLANIPDQTTPEDTPLRVAVAVGDLDTNAAALNLSATSSLQSLVPDANLQFTGTGANRSLTVTPATNAIGTATITVTVTDPAGAVATDTFTLTVTGVNDAPTINELTDRTINEDAAAQDVLLTGISAGAANENQPLTFAATSSNPALIPTPTVRYTNGNTTGVLNFRPATNATGTTTLTITADDGQAENRFMSRSFVITVVGTNDAPSISVIDDQSTPEDAPLTIPFTIGDPDTLLLNLSLTATSTNTNLIAITNILFNGSGTDRSVTLVPTTNQFGTSLITLRLTDGVQTNLESFVLTVNAVNDPPTLNPIAHFQTNSASGNPVFTVALSGISDGATNENQNVTFSAVSTNTALLPNPTVAYSNPDTTATLTLRPANNSGGVSLVTVTANDNSGGNSTVSQSFLVFIKSSANTLPTVSVISAQTMGEDTTSAPLNFSVRDTETPVGSVTVLARSSNPQLLPDANIVITGSTTTNRSVTLTPALNQTGTVAVTLTAVDAAFGSSNMTFNVTVTNVNDAPTISSIANQTIFESTPTAVLSFTVGDVETRPGDLSVTATSANQTLVPNGNILLGGTGANRGVLVTPAPGQTGTASITIRVSDGVASNSTAFVLTVNATNQPPTLTAIPNVTTSEDIAASSAPFTIGDRETLLGALNLAASSSNPALVPAGNIAFNGTGAERTVVLTPQPNLSGTALITVTVTDGSNAVTARQFTFTVQSINDPPTLDPIAAVLINENAGPQSIPLAGIGSGAANEVQSLTVTATSTNTELVANIAVSYTTPAGTGTLTFNPVPNTNGVAVISVTVSDGQATNGLTTRDLIITMNAAPAVVYVPDQTTLEDTPSAPIQIVLTDRDTPASEITLVATSANQALVPDAGIAVQGTGANRTLIVTPATNQFGLVQINLSVTDTNGASSTNHFFLTIEPVVDPIHIVSPPQDFSALAGTTAHFGVTATSALPLTYQWQRDGTDILGATGTELNLAAVQLTDTGDFRVIISNADTSITSSTAQLVVRSTATSPTIVSITQAGNVVNVSFASTLGVNYTLEYKNSLSDPQWTAAGSTQGNGTIAVLVDSDQTRPTRFYRVRAN